MYTKLKNGFGVWQSIRQDVPNGCVEKWWFDVSRFSSDE
jgi:hypothetical protein